MDVRPSIYRSFVCVHGEPYPKNIIKFALLGHVAGVLEESIESDASMDAMGKFSKRKKLYS